MINLFKKQSGTCRDHFRSHLHSFRRFFCILAALSCLASLIVSAAATETVSAATTYFTAKAIDGKTYYHDIKYKDCTLRYGVDVSHWNGNIDWNKLKSEGVEFAIIRLGYRQLSATGAGKIVKDEKAETYLAGAKAAGIKVGGYFYSQAINTTEAKAEAQFMIDLLDGMDLDLPLCMDVETPTNSRLTKANLSAKEYMAIWKAFRDTIEAAGYNAMYYTYPSIIYSNFNMTANADEIAAEMASDHRMWMSRPSTYFHKDTDSWKWPDNYELTIWQCSWEGKLEGNGAEDIDIDIWYDDGTNLGSCEQLETTGSNSSGNTTSDYNISIINGAEEYIVAAPYIRMYAEPDEASKTITDNVTGASGILTEGTSISVYDTQTGSDGLLWGRIVYNRQSCWIPLKECVRR